MGLEGFSLASESDQRLPPCGEEFRWGLSGVPSILPCYRRSCPLSSWKTGGASWMTWAAKRMSTHFS
jgi:hypothetical protein